MGPVEVFLLTLKARDPDLPAALCTEAPPASQSLVCVLRLPPRQPGDGTKTKELEDY